MPKKDEKHKKACLFIFELDIDYKNDFGRYIRDISAIKDEEEWLLNVGTQIKVSKIKPN